MHICRSDFYYFNPTVLKLSYYQLKLKHFYLVANLLRFIIRLVNGRECIQFIKLRIRKMQVPNIYLIRYTFYIYKGMKRDTITIRGRMNSAQD